jgi:hypothetical protein
MTGLRHPLKVVVPERDPGTLSRGHEALGSACSAEAAAAAAKVGSPRVTSSGFDGWCTTACP